jgi:hypothetical protein
MATLLSNRARQRAQITIDRSCNSALQAGNRRAGAARKAQATRQVSRLKHPCASCFVASWGTDPTRKVVWVQVTSMIAAGPKGPVTLGGSSGGDEPLKINIGSGMMGASRELRQQKQQGHYYAASLG